MAAVDYNCGAFFCSNLKYYLIHIYKSPSTFKHVFIKSKMIFRFHWFIVICMINKADIDGSTVITTVRHYHPYKQPRFTPYECDTFHLFSFFLRLVTERACEPWPLSYPSKGLLLMLALTAPLRQPTLVRRCSRVGASFPGLRSTT